MRIKITTPEGDVRLLNLKAGAAAADAAAALRINPEVVLFVRFNKNEKTVIPDLEKLRNGDSIELLKVVSGG